MKNIFKLIIIFVMICCSSLQIENEDYNVLNAYLKNHTKVDLINENYFNGSTLGYFGMYKKWYDAELKTKDKIGILFNGKVDWIFSKKDIEYMKNKYNKWEKGYWDRNNVGSNINLIDSKPNSYGMSINYRISYPFYDKTMTKAMIIVSKNESPLSGGINIILMKKINGNWVEVGGLPYSVS